MFIRTGLKSACIRPTEVQFHSTFKWIFEPQNLLSFPSLELKIISASEMTYIVSGGAL